MYKKLHGIIETLAPLHVGATAGEESGNLNMIFRDQFTQTGIIPGSSVRGRMRAEMRIQKGEIAANKWYGNQPTEASESTTESLVKFEYASIVWIPVFCPGQPIVWVTCPYLLKRYKRIAGMKKEIPIPKEYTASTTLKSLNIEGEETLFFNFGFLTVKRKKPLTSWFPLGEELPAVVVKDDEISMVHDMALYRQSRVALEKEEKKAKGKAFFNTEALPEGTILSFPIAIKENKYIDEQWEPFPGSNEGEIYLGGLESIGFGNCQVIIKEVQ